MDIRDTSQLQGDPHNPRTISKHDGEALAKSMKEFGDLSCIVNNVATGQLVGGHQRINILEKVMGGAQVTITQRFDQPDAVGTVALGYVVYNGVQYAYREVSWDIGRQKAANIAANRIQGEFDLDMLAQVNYEISQMENGLELLGQTGQTNKEVQKMLEASGAIEGSEPSNEPPNKLEVALTPEQRETVERAMEHMRSSRDITPWELASVNGAALYLICWDYLVKAEQPVQAQPSPGELTDLPS